jgi:hypothetical protein
MSQIGRSPCPPLDAPAQSEEDTWTRCRWRTRRGPTLNAPGRRSMAVARTGVTIAWSSSPPSARGPARRCASHNSREATLRVLAGNVRLTAGTQALGPVAGDLLTVPDEAHALDAVEDSAVLLTVGLARPARSPRRAVPARATPGTRAGSRHAGDCARAWTGARPNFASHLDDGARRRRAASGVDAA